MFKHISHWFSKPKYHPKKVAYRAQEIWWCSVPSATDAAAERPVLVFRTLGTDTFWGLPLTSRANTKEKPFYFLASLRGAHRTAALSQMRMLRTDQLIRKVGKISDRQFASVNVAVMEFLAETNPVRPARVRRSIRKPVQLRTPLPRTTRSALPFQPVYTLKFR
jgi:mRNA-degrading endonuclease toxin of MazEF toxin-antitoxin module